MHKNKFFMSLSKFVRCMYGTSRPLHFASFYAQQISKIHAKSNSLY